MEKEIVLTQTEYVTNSYRIVYSREDFNADVKRADVKGITFEELQEILMGRLEDKVISFLDYKGNEQHCFAEDFFSDCLREISYEYDPYDSRIDDEEKEFTIEDVEEI